MFIPVTSVVLALFLCALKPAAYGEKVKAALPSMVDALQSLATPTDAKSLYELGTFLESILSYADALGCYRKAAEQGFAAAQNNLGYCYHEGAVVPRNYPEAVRWYRKAAAQGFAAAQNNLGVCFRDSIGVPQDFGKAVHWFRLAAEQGLAAAQNNLGVRYYKGQGVETNYVEAVRFYRKAAEQGLPDALVNLAICYTDGRGVPEDRVKAFIYLNTAASHGDRFAAQVRQFLQKKMTSQQIAEGQRGSRAVIGDKSFVLPD
jgi:TPR repeat protein